MPSLQVLVRSMVFLLALAAAATCLRSRASATALEPSDAAASPRWTASYDVSRSDYRLSLGRGALDLGIRFEPRGGGIRVPDSRLDAGWRARRWSPTCRRSASACAALRSGATRRPATWSTATFGSGGESLRQEGRNRVEAGAIAGLPEPGPGHPPRRRRSADGAHEEGLVRPLHAKQLLARRAARRAARPCRTRQRRPMRWLPTRSVASSIRWQRHAATARAGLVLRRRVAAPRLAAPRRRARTRARGASANRSSAGVPKSALRVLVLGDSTGVGIGANRPEESIAGLLAQDFPAADIVNVSRSGARVADALGAGARVSSLGPSLRRRAAACRRQRRAAGDADETARRGLRAAARRARRGGRSDGLARAAEPRHRAALPAAVLLGVRGALARRERACSRARRPRTTSPSSTSRRASTRSASSAAATTSRSTGCIRTARATATAMPRRGASSASSRARRVAPAPAARERPTVARASLRSTPSSLNRIAAMPTPHTAERLAGQLQPTIGGSTYVDPEQLPWQPSQFEKIQMKVLYRNEAAGEMTVLLKWEPGATLPFHRHPEIEQSWVLEGSFYDHDGICRAGQFVWRTPGIDARDAQRRRLRDPGDLPQAQHLSQLGRIRRRGRYRSRSRSPSAAPPWRCSCRSGR